MSVRGPGKKIHSDSLYAFKAKATNPVGFNNWSRHLNLDEKPDMSQIYSFIFYFLPIRRWFAPGFVNYKKGCTRLAAANDKVYQLLAHVRWFSPGSPSSSTTKTGRLHHVFPILSVILTKYHYIILTDYPGIQFHRYIS
jgi:hypothetical protein